MTIIVHKFRESSYPRKNGYYANGRWVNPAAGDRVYDSSRVFVDFKGETILDNLNNRVGRPYNALKPLVIAALENEGIKFEKIRWSQKAGCRMCPCSPGFIIEGHDGKDFWMTVTDDSEYPARSGL